MPETESQSAEARPDTRTRPDRPIVAVGAVVLNAQEEVLLIRRSRPPRTGEWSLPGGAVDLGETVEAAVAREVLEETGLIVEVTHHLANINSITPDTDGTPLFHYVLLDYQARVLGGTLQAGSDALDARFFPVAEAIELVQWKETKRLLEKATTNHAGDTA